jgi:dTDP-4-dehydrorhamnose 3,5-epimerase
MIPYSGKEEKRLGKGSAMNIENTTLDGVKILTWEQKEDNRGVSFDFWNGKEMEKEGIRFHPVSARCYATKKAGTLYGIHFQDNPEAQAKLLFCVNGSGIDYAVDLRKGSSTFGKWVSVILSSANRKQIFIPVGFGHAFFTLEDDTENVMLVDVPFSELSRQIRWDDPELNLRYPYPPKVLAPHDKEAPFLALSDLNL